MTKIICDTQEEKRNILEIFYESGICPFCSTPCPYDNENIKGFKGCKECIDKNLQIDVIK